MLPCLALVAFFLPFLMQNKSWLDVEMFICILCWNIKQNGFYRIVRSSKLKINQRKTEQFYFSLDYPNYLILERKFNRERALKSIGTKNALSAFPRFSKLNTRVL